MSYLEGVTVGLQDLVKPIYISQTNGLSHLKVRSQSMAHRGLTEDVPFRDVTHQQLDGHEELLHRLFEADGSVLRAFS